MIWSLQVLRFAAALMVAYAHTIFATNHSLGWIGYSPKEFAALGTAGVDLFFVLSGVVIAKTAPRLTPAQFVWRRVRRIIPIYFVCSIPFVIIAVAQGNFAWRDALATFLLWPATDRMALPVLNVGWTLMFEMLFYASAALALLHRRWLYVLLALYAVAFLLRSVGPVFQFLGNALVLEFLFGVALAHTPLVRFGVATLPVGAGLLLTSSAMHLIPTGDIIEYVTGADSAQRVLVMGIPAALVVYGTMHIKATPGVWAYLGDASYALYLVHPTVIVAMTAVWPMISRQPDGMIFVGTALCVLVAWRVHELIEKPLLRALPKDQLSVTFGST